MARIIVDYRERKIIDVVKGICADVETSGLPVGDILILKDRACGRSDGLIAHSAGTAIMIERKTLYDFMSSINSGRIWDQMRRLMEIKGLYGYQITQKLLVIHGGFDEYFERVPASL